MIHTEIWQSRQVAGLSIEARLLYVGLISLGDDDGRLKGDAALLRAQIFPRDPNVTVTQVESWLKEITDAKLVALYESDGEHYLAHPNWTKYQTLRADRKKESNVPPPPATLFATVGQPTVNQPAAQGKVSKDKEKKEKVRASFDEFWKEYPNKTAKKKAEQSWEKIMAANNPDEIYPKIMAGLARSKMSPQWQKDGGQYIPHPTTWLNGERWNDEGAGAAGAKKTHRV